MRHSVGILIVTIWAIVALAVSVAAQTPAPQGTASISGRVTLNGRGFANAQVLLTSQPKDSDNAIQRLTGAKSAQKTATDADGRYSFTNLAAGPYEIQVFAPALVGSGHDDAIMAADAEAVDGIDFALTAGGVITGSVLTANGRPAINKPIHVELAGQQQNGSESSAATMRAMMRQVLGRTSSTDDRGVYRIYGVPAGDYVVGVVSAGGSRETLATYYPGVTDKAKATAVKVRAGAESTGIDFKLGLSKKGYEVRGRVVDESGNGVPSVMIIISPVGEQAEGGAAFSGLSGQSHSNSKGEFKIEGLHPGKYNASVFSMFDEVNSYSDATTFEITTGDASGVEIKTHKGLSASGVAVIEGNDDPAVAAQLPQVQLMATTESMAGFGMSRATVAPDGTFTISGLRPGKFVIMTSPLAQDSRFSILGIERGGAAQDEGIEISPDSPVTDIKLVLGYRNCTIFGRLTTSGGVVPKGTGVNVSIRRLGADGERTGTYRAEHYMSMAMGGGSGTSREFTVSSGGDFRADSLVPGDYEVTARVLDKPGTREADLKSLTQKVTLTSGSQLEVNLVLDLSPNK